SNFETKTLYSTHKRLSFNEATLRIFSAHELESRKQRPPKASLPTRPKLESKKICNQLILPD
ncbi:hypothetical protein M2G91_21150, partial [Vibrio vulnificus]|nr:hypothetical protein [Vibrio vulnificus]